MSTVASLQIKIGADVSAAISGLSRAEFAADQVKEAYIAANNASVQTGAAIAVWAQNFGTAAGAVQREINGINTDNLTLESQESVASLKNIIDTSVKVSQSVTVMASAFSGAQAIAGPALAGIARLIPSIGASLAALAGPIGIAVGLAAALGAAYLSNAGSITRVLTEQQKLNQSITQEIAQAGVLFGVLKSGNLTNEKRGALIEDINKKYDTTLKNLKDETEFVAQVDVAYQRLGESIKNKILLAGSQKELEGLIAQQIETEKLREGLIAAGKAVPGLNEQLASIGGPAQAFNPETFLGGAKGIVDINAKIDGQQSIINKKLADMASLYNKVFSEAGKGGGGGKGVETEAQKIQSALNELGKSLEIIQEKNKSGLLPDEDVFKQQEASFKKAIDSIANINIKSDAFKNLVADYKSLAQAEEIQLPFTPVIKVDEVASITLAPLADRMKKVVEDKLSGIKILIDDTASLDSVKSFAEKFKKEIEAISKVADIAGQIGSALAGAIGQSNANEFEGRRQALDAYYEREQELIETSIGSDTIKNRKKEQLDKEVSQKRKQIAREEAQSQKNLNIFEAVINTANAVTRALATGGPILAGIVGALGLAQISAISSAPLPALAGGGLVTGPSVVQVGEYPGANNNPEFISPVDKAQKYIREAVQQAGGSSAQQLFSYIDGDDIVLISERGNYRKQRLG